MARPAGHAAATTAGPLAAAARRCRRTTARRLAPAAGTAARPLAAAARPLAAAARCAAGRSRASPPGLPACGHTSRAFPLPPAAPIRRRKRRRRGNRPCRRGLRRASTASRGPPVPDPSVPPRPRPRVNPLRPLPRRWSTRRRPRRSAPPAAGDAAAEGAAARRSRKAAGRGARRPGRSAQGPGCPAGRARQTSPRAGEVPRLSGHPGAPHPAAQAAAARAISLGLSRAAGPRRPGRPPALRPAVDEAGRIFLHLRGRLFAIEESEGKPKILWEYVTGKHVPGPVVLGPNQSVLLHATDGYLHCLDAATGKQNWPPACVGEPLGYAAPVVDDEGNTWLSGFDGGILKVDAGGHLQKPGPFLRSRQKFDSAAILVGGVLYAAAESGYVFAIQAEGERGVNLWKHAGDHGFAGWCVHSAPAMTDDNVLILPGHDDLLCGFADGGLPVFKTSMPGQMLGSPVLDRYGHIYVGVSQLPRGFELRGLLVCLDGNSHMIRWEYRAAGAVESTPVIGDDDVIYFGDNAGVVHAVDFLGNGLWTADLGPPVRGAGTIPASGRVAFGLDDETLVVLKCSSTGLAPAGWPKLGRTLGQSGTK